MEPEFTDSARAALLWVLWHHQGGSSPVGQPIRFALGMGKHDRMTDAQVAQAKLWGELMAQAPKVKTAAEIAYDAKHDTSCVGAFARARP